MFIAVVLLVNTHGEIQFVAKLDISKNCNQIYTIRSSRGKQDVPRSSSDTQNISYTDMEIPPPKIFIDRKTRT